MISDGIYTITAVHSATSLTLNTAYVGVTGNGFTHTILYGGRLYQYVETATDTIATTTTNLVNAINSGNDPYLYAVQANEYNRMILYSYAAGPSGENINIFEQTTTNVVANADIGAQLSITVYNPSTCCDAPANLPVTIQNPAKSPGEARSIRFSTGIGPTNPANIPSGPCLPRRKRQPARCLWWDSILVQGLVATVPMNVALVPDSR